jgi:hypothetical protein
VKVPPISTARRALGVDSMNGRLSVRLSNDVV